MTKKVKKSTSLEVGVGLAAIAVATVAGGYFLYGKKGATNNRKKVKGWMLKAKGEVLEKMEKSKEITEETYREVIDKVSQKYQNLKDIDQTELQQMVKELKGHWKSIKNQLMPAPKKKAVKK